MSRPTLCCAALVLYGIHWGLLGIQLPGLSTAHLDHIWAMPKEMRVWVLCHWIFVCQESRRYRSGIVPRRPDRGAGNASGWTDRRIDMYRDRMPKWYKAPNLINGNKDAIAY